LQHRASSLFLTMQRSGTVLIISVSNDGVGIGGFQSRQR